MTDSSGQPAGYFEYDSHGTQTHGPTTSTTPFRWHGTLGVTTDPGGLVHMRARFYHPRLMRFLNQYPIGFAGGMNWFAAFDNNPISNVDPSGLMPIDLPPDPGFPIGSPERASYDQKRLNGLAVGAAIAGTILTAGELGPVVFPYIVAGGMATQQTIQRAPALVRQSASTVNNISLQAQAAVMNQTPALWNAAYGGIGVVTGGSPNTPEIVQMGNKWATYGQMAGTIISNREYIYNTSNEIFRTTDNIYDSINNQYFTPVNNNYGIPSGSVILSVPSPSSPGKGLK